MKIAILGSNGFIGKNLINNFPDAISINRNNYNDYLNDHFDLLINCSGNSNKRTENKKQIMDNFNSNVLDLIKISFDFNVDKIVHLSSAEVYGDLSENTNENTEINPSYLSCYGLNKYLGECIVKRYYKKWTILRLNGIIGQHLRKGFCYDILTQDRIFMSEKSKFQILHTDYIAKFIKKITKWNEVYNLTSKDSMHLSDVMKTLKRKVESPKKPVIRHNIDVSKASNIMKIPTCLESLEKLF